MSEDDEYTYDADCGDEYTYDADCGDEYTYDADDDGVEESKSPDSYTDEMNTYIKTMCEIYSITTETFIVYLLTNKISKASRTFIDLDIYKYETYNIPRTEKVCICCFDEITVLNELKIKYVSNKCMSNNCATYKRNICNECYGKYIYSFLSKYKYPNVCIDKDCCADLFITPSDLYHLTRSTNTTDELTTICTKIADESFIKLSEYFIKCFKCDTYINTVELKNNSKDSFYQNQCSNCKAHICTHCNGEYHAPATCNEKKKFLTIYETRIETNCRACINCGIMIIKDNNKSCLKMTCTKCDMVFCWHCMRPYSDHMINVTGFYRCEFPIYNNNGVYSELLDEYYMFEKNQYCAESLDEKFVFLIMKNYIIFYNFNFMYDLIKNQFLKYYVSVKKLKFKKHEKKIKTYVNAIQLIECDSDIYSKNPGAIIDLSFIKDYVDESVDIYYNNDISISDELQNIINQNVIAHIPFMKINESISIKVTYDNTFIIIDGKEVVLQVQKLNSICKNCTYRNVLTKQPYQVCNMCSSILLN